MSNVYKHSVYAYVQDGKILSYPVFPNHITKRGHPVSFYTPVVKGVVVEPKELHYVKDELSYDKEKDVVVIDQHLVALPVQSILNKLYEGQAEDVQLMINQVAPESIPLIFSQISNIAQQRLDAFAQERNYDNIVSLVGYSSSTVARFQADAQKGVTARDNTWAPLIALMESIVTATAPVPRKESDILSVLPALTWS